MICENCGETFERRSQYGPQPKFCSSNCRQDAFRKRHPDRPHQAAEPRRKRLKERWDTDPGYRARVQAANDRYVAERREWLDAYKQERGCADCGTHEGRLDFDHRPGEVKLFNLGRPKASWAKIKAELAKCDVRCARCHARRHNLAGNESLSTVEIPGLAA